MRAHSRRTSSRNALQGGEVAVAERAGVAIQMVGDFQPFEPRRAVEGEVELFVVHDVEHQHVVPALPEEPQAAEQAGPIGQQVRDEDHQAAPRGGFGDAAEDRVHVGLVSRLLDGERIDDAENVVVLACGRGR